MTPDWYPNATETFPDSHLVPFLRESLGIEGINRDPTEEEIAATRRFLRASQVSPKGLHDLHAVYAPGKPLRDHPGMNVRVGQYVAPEGGPKIASRLDTLCRKAASASPWSLHVEFEALHPYMDGNGRTGRALWAWAMQYRGMQPFALPFLHRFYYQTLADCGPVVAARWARK